MKTKTKTNKKEVERKKTKQIFLVELFFPRSLTIYPGFILRFFGGARPSGWEPTDQLYKK